MRLLHVALWKFLMWETVWAHSGPEVLLIHWTEVENESKDLWLGPACWSTPVCARSDVRINAPACAHEWAWHVDLEQRGTLFQQTQPRKLCRAQGKKKGASVCMCAFSVQSQLQRNTRIERNPHTFLPRWNVENASTRRIQTWLILSIHSRVSWSSSSPLSWQYPPPALGSTSHLGTYWNTSGARFSLSTFSIYTQLTKCIPTVCMCAFAHVIMPCNSPCRDAAGFLRKCSLEGLSHLKKS